MGNNTVKLEPYKLQGLWVLNDPVFGDVAEQFLPEIGEIIDRMVVNLKSPQRGFQMLVSDEPFTEQHYTLERVRAEDSGHVYHCLDFDLAGWLAIDQFLDLRAPQNLFIKVADRKLKPGSSSVFLINPYKYEGTWVFDDEDVGLVKEAFVSGADEIIDFMVKELKDPEHGFRMSFSDNYFYGYQCKFVRSSEESGGNWYYSADFDHSGWLCPALYKYYWEAPGQLYVQVRSRKN